MSKWRNRSERLQQARTASCVEGRPLVNRRVDWAFFLCAFLGPLVLYRVSMPTTVVLEDDGLFLMVIKHLGIAHPPGYPLYTLLGHLFVSLPGNVAMLGHLFSGITMAGACALVYICARLMMAGPWPALAGAWLFGASEHVWSQALIAEVYALNALLFFAIYALLLRSVSSPNAHGTWLLAAVLLGLSLANHWPLMVLAFPGLVVGALPAWKRLLPRLPFLAGLSITSAALPYGWLIWRSRQEPIINFSGPIHSWERFWHYLSRQDYAGVDVSAAAGWGDRLAFLGWFAQQVAVQLSVPGLALALLGLAVLLRRRQWTLLSSSLLVFIGNSIVLLLLLAFEFNDNQVSVFRPYPLVCFGLLGIWLAMGAQALLEWICRQHPLEKILPPEMLAKLGVILAAAATVALTTSSVQTHWPRNNRSDSNFTHNYAEVIFDLLPRNAILIVNGDTDTAPLGYYHFVENHRPDVKLLNAQGLIFNNRLYQSNLPRRDKQKIFIDFLQENNDRPLFFVDIGNLVLPYGIRDHGLVKEMIAGSDAATLQLQHHLSVEDYYKTLLTETLQDSWEKDHRDKLIYSYGYYLGLVIMANEPVLLARTQEVRAMAETSFFSLMGIVEALLEKGNQSHVTQAGQILEMAESRRPDQLGADLAARLLYVKGFISFQQGNPQAALALFEESKRLYPKPDNPSLNALQKLQANP